MADVILHIGTHKTATTSIQKTMMALRGTLLEQGILYPQAGIIDHNHGWLALSVRDRLVETNPRPDAPGEVWNDLRRELDRVRPRVAVLSNEVFYLFDEPQVARVAEELAGHNVRVLVYLRNQWDFLLSLYKEVLKKCVTLSFQDFIQTNIALCDYQAMIARWTSAFGTGAVDVRVYDRVKRGPGVVPDFLSRIGSGTSSMGEVAAAETLANASGPDENIRLMLWLNRLEPRLPGGRRKAAVFGRLRRRLNRDGTWMRLLARLAAPVLTPPLWTERDYRWVRDAVGPLNDRFFPLLADRRDAECFELNRVTGVETA